MPMSLAEPEPTVDLLHRVDDATRREFAGVIAAAGLLAACGRREDVDASTSRPTTRTAQTPRGPVEIPADPQRVVAVYTHDLANALVLGLPVIAGPGEGGGPGAAFPTYLSEAFPEQVAKLTRIGHRPQPSIERIASLRPDAILAGIFGSAVDDPVLAKLDGVAPTVTYSYSEGERFVVVPWRDVLRENARAFGRQQAAESWIARFEERAGDLRERLAARWSGATWAVVEPYVEDIYLYGPKAGHTTLTLTEELGLSPARFLGRVPGGQTAAELSYERLPELDADIVFLPVFLRADGKSDRSGVDVLSSKPGWADVPAVRAGEVHEMSGDILYESGVMATAWLDVVEEALLG